MNDLSVARRAWKKKMGKTLKRAKISPRQQRKMLRAAWNDGTAEFIDWLEAEVVEEKDGNEDQEG